MMAEEIAKKYEPSVTISTLHEVVPGSCLTVYQGDKKIGKVVVDTAFDVISYVSPIDGILDKSSTDYYRVVKE